MPTYQYACTSCGHRFEAVQSFSDAALTECPECAGRLRKVFSSVGVVFKGSGFYRTDSRSAPKDGAADSGSGDGKPEKTDKTPAATPSSNGAGSGSPAKAPASAGSGSGSGSSGTSPSSSGAGKSAGGTTKAGAASGSTA